MKRYMKYVDGIRNPNYMAQFKEQRQTEVPIPEGRGAEEKGRVEASFDLDRLPMDIADLLRRFIIISDLMFGQRLKL